MISVRLLFFSLLCFQLVVADWETCALCDVPGQNGKFLDPRANDRVAQCRTFDAPLDWGNYTLDERRIQLFTKRYFSGKQTAVSLFVIGGQPGESHIAAEREIVPMLLSQFNELITVYTVDVRGVGYSTNFDCPKNTTLAECNEYLNEQYGADVLKEFSITNAAFDLVYMINKVREETEVREIWLYAYGFGTIIMNRFFQIDKELIDAAVFDSVPAIDPFYFSSHDSDANEVGLRFLEGCDLSAYCNAQLSGSPRRALEDIYLRGSTCFPSYLDGVAVKRVITLMLYDRTYQPLIAPLIKRATRCTEDDRDRIASLVGKVIEEYTRRYPPYDTTERSISAAYQYIISEHYTPGALPNQNALKAATDELLFADYRALSVGSIWSKWYGKYTPDTYWKKFPDPKDPNFIQLPLIIFGPAFDALDNPKFGQSLAINYRKRYFGFERGTHNALVHSRTRNGKTCGFTIMQQLFFSFNHTLKDADLSCLNQLEDIDYECLRKDCLRASLKYFGTTDAFGGKPDGTVEDIHDKDYYVDIDPLSSFYINPSPSPKPSPSGAAAESLLSLALSSLFFASLLLSLLL